MCLSASSLCYRFEGLGFGFPESRSETKETSHRFLDARILVAEARQPDKLTRSIGSPSTSNIGALIIGYWCPLYYTYNKEPQNRIGNY